MNRMRSTLKTGLLLFAFLAVAQQAVVEITSEPSHHQVFNNAQLRVFNVMVAPKKSTLVHKHNYDYIFVTLGDSDITNAKVGAAPVEVKLQDGDVRFTPGNFAHAAINNSDKEFHNITIELLQPTTNEHGCSGSCTVETPCSATDKSKCAVVQRLLVSDQWTVTSVTLPPSSTYEQHSHAGNHFTVAVSDLDLKIKDRNGRENEVHRKVGDVGWHEPTTHAITNAGPQPARFVSLEFTGSGSETRNPL